MRNLIFGTQAATCAFLVLLTSLFDSPTSAAEKRPRAAAGVAVGEVVVEEDAWELETVEADPGCRVLEPCRGLPQGLLWCEADYLLWWTKGMEIPPLVTTGTTGVLGAPDTRILYGDETILDDARSGFRVGLGSWFDCGRGFGLEADYWMLGDATDHFRAASNSAGSPPLFRPFFNVNPRGADNGFGPPAHEDAEVVSSPGLLAGAVDVDSYSQLQGAGIRFRRQLCCASSCSGGCDPCCQTFQRTTRLDLLVGYRYVQLREGITIREDLTSLLPPPEQGDFDIVDQFGTTNTFNGADLGVTWRAQCGPWLVDILGKLALGGVQQTVLIGGQTVISGSANDDGTYVGGLLAQRTNMGQHRRNVFAMTPELGVSLGYQLTPGLSAKIGYNFLYWSRVVRPGDEIDLDVNPDLLPPETEFAGAARPSFEWRDTDYWAQGIRVGLEGVW